MTYLWWWKYLILTKSNNFGISEVIAEGFETLEELKYMVPELFI
jgi:hypothetical protein